MTDIVIVCNNRAERGPLESVIAVLPEAEVVALPPAMQVADPVMVMRAAMGHFETKFDLFSPKVIVLLGDRYETLAAALAATFLRIKIVHIHGGETTTGAFDDAFRHSITHLTEQSGGWHCVATPQALCRVQRLLDIEHEDDCERRIEITGAPGLDGVEGNSARRDYKRILVTYHPETRDPHYGADGCVAMLDALAPYARDGYEIYFMGVNNDPGKLFMEGRMHDFIVEMHPQCAWKRDVSHQDYISLMQSASLVIGNSSAGVIEAPWVGCPSVNIGYRQDGRPMANSVFSGDSIGLAIKRALDWCGAWQPIYQGGAAPKIAKIVWSLL